MKTLRLGLVGRGRWGENIARTLETFPDVFFSVIEKGDSSSYNFDGVLIATPSATHAAVALPFLERGIPTFIEKPMATSIADATLLETAVEKSKAILFVGYIHLFNPAFIKAKELLPHIGAIRTIICESANANSRDDSSIMWDWLPHDLSIARALLKQEAVSAQAWNVADSRMLSVSKFLFGDVALISTMSALSSEKRRFVTIVGTEGTLVLDETAKRKLALYQNDREVLYPEYEPISPLENELTTFIAAIRTGISTGPGIEDGTAVVRAITAAEKATEDNISITSI